MQLKRVTNEGTVIKYKATMEGAWGRTPQMLGDFCDFAAKKKQFLCHFNRTSHVLSHTNHYIAKIQKLFQRRIKFLRPFSSPLLQIKSKIRLNAHILRLNFYVTWLRELKPLHPGCVTDRDLQILSVL